MILAEYTPPAPTVINHERLQMPSGLANLVITNSIYIVWAIHIIVIEADPDRKSISQ